MKYLIETMNPKTTGGTDAMLEAPDILNIPLLAMPAGFVAEIRQRAETKTGELLTPVQLNKVMLQVNTCDGWSDPGCNALDFTISLWWPEDD